MGDHGFHKVRGNEDIPITIITFCWLKFVHPSSYLHLGDINNVDHPNLVQLTLFSIVMDYGVNIASFAHLSGPLFPRAPSLGRYYLTFMCFWSFMSPFPSFQGLYKLFSILHYALVILFLCFNDIYGPIGFPFSPISASLKFLTPFMHKCASMCSSWLHSLVFGNSSSLC